ncbi:hypothetical protein [Ideonella sp. A 288]|uniref:hypothetical protein n=1 Tax=Ideonella sp. A 288 TaxID=1962181 RepID=UPI000B4A6411|nr:hypothetical protein [Ideonella sp. A 288]
MSFHPALETFHFTRVKQEAPEALVYHAVYVSIASTIAIFITLQPINGEFLAGLAVAGNISQLGLVMAKDCTQLYERVKAQIGIVCSQFFEMPS